MQKPHPYSAVKVNGVKVPYVIAPRRPGDIATCFANVSLAKEELKWTAVHSLEDACRSSWNFQSKNICCC